MNKQLPETGFLRFTQIIGDQKKGIPPSFPLAILHGGMASNPANIRSPSSSVPGQPPGESKTSTLWSNQSNGGLL